MPRVRLNDGERELWVNNHEGLYNLWRRSNKSLRVFVRANRETIDAVIKAALNQEPKP